MVFKKENRNKDKEVVNNSVLLKIITEKDYENIDYIKEKLKYNVEYRVGIIELKNKDKDIIEYDIDNSGRQHRPHGKVRVRQTHEERQRHQ